MIKNLSLLLKKFLLGVFCLSAFSTVLFAEDYSVAFDKSQDYTHATRRLTAVSLKGSSDGDQAVSLPEPLKVYTYISDKIFTLRPGEVVTPDFSFTEDWMHGYVYLDKGHDGVFDAAFDSLGRIPAESDIIAFSYAESATGSGNGFNSAGAAVSNLNVLDPPAFTLPTDLPHGFYLMRFKVDWASIDPAGRMGDDNNILRNGGAICDVVVNVHGDVCTVNSAAVNGCVVAADGTALDGLQHQFGEPLTIKALPDEGYLLDAIRIKYGYNLQGDSLLHGVPQYREKVIPAYLMQNGEFTIDSEYLAGEIVIEGIFEKQADDISNGEQYALSFDTATELTNTTYRLQRMNYTPAGSSSKAVLFPSDIKTVYTNMQSGEVLLSPGTSVLLSAGVASEGLHYYLYIDLNNDGCFTPLLNGSGTPACSSELVAFTYYNGVNSDGETKAADEPKNRFMRFVLSDKLPSGIYRVRLKSDNNNIDPAGSEQIVGNGGMIIDFYLNVTKEKNNLSLYAMHGNIYGGNNTALPLTLSSRQPIDIVAVPVASGYKLNELKVRHGYNLDGPQFVNGNRQWDEYEPGVATFTIPAERVNGDVRIYADFLPTADAEYYLVFSDEFNAKDGSQPIDDKWMRCQRMGATWNRWLSDSKEVVYIENGNLVTRAIPNPDTQIDNVPMITGGIKTMNRFGFTYGRVECRLLSNPWVGNFPALWMMPEDQSAGWPDCGEIDIFETIDAQERSWHTVHSNWTYDLGHSNNPTSSFNTAVNLDRYHTYALEWDETSLVWYVDGVEVGRYSKSTNQSYLNQGQWPFDKHFHLILNQSVGNGSWAANADVTHTYETLFDWVRVYQKNGMKNTNGTVGVEDVTEVPEMNIRIVDGGVGITVSSPMQVVTCDLSGRIIYNSFVENSVVIELAQGVYVINGMKLIVR